MPVNTFQRRSARTRHANNRSRRTYKRTGGRRPNQQTIHPSRFVKPAKIVDVVPFEPKHTFDDFNLNELLLNNIKRKGYVQPSPIQDEAIPAGIAGDDIVGIANTGTGKTAAFALPVLHQLITDSNTKALIVAPTRELAEQIEAECQQIAKGSGLYGALLIGGSSMGHQLRDLRHNPRIVIGTPGRIKDHLERHTLDLSSFNIVVLDEVDRMLDMGFINDMRDILEKLSSERQSFFFSATLDSKVRTLINTFVSSPVTISVKTGDTSDNVEQNVIGYRGKSEKLEMLHTTLTEVEGIKALIFAETQRNVEQLSNDLAARGFNADSIHGGKSQGQRQRALRRFKSNEITILVATDVAARGIDVADVTHVLNYEVPGSYEDYVHRIGRAGRAGRKGYALTFIEI